LSKYYLSTIQVIALDITRWRSLYNKDEGAYPVYNSFIVLPDERAWVRRQASLSLLQYASL
jgi:hypothetical protein